MHLGLVVSFIAIISFSFAKDYAIQACKNMFENSPKKSVLMGSAQNILTGMALGAAIGYISALVQGKAEDAMKRAMLGAIGGATTGIIYSIYKNKSKLHKSRKALVKELNYSPEYGNVFQIVYAKVEGNKSYFKAGEFIPIVIRFNAIKPNPEEPVEIFYKGKLYHNGKLIGIFYDKIYIPQGQSADVFAIPVCKGAKPGEYTLELTATSSGISDTTRVSWHIGGRR